MPSSFVRRRRAISGLEEVANAPPIERTRATALELTRRLQADRFTWLRYQSTQCLQVWEAFALHLHLDPALVLLTHPGRRCELEDWASVLQPHELLPRYMEGLRRIEEEFCGSAELPLSPKLQSLTSVVRIDEFKPLANSVDPLPVDHPRVVSVEDPSLMLGELIDAFNRCYTPVSLGGTYRTGTRPDLSEVLSAEHWKPETLRFARSVLRPFHERKGGRPGKY